MKPSEPTPSPRKERVKINMPVEANSRIVNGGLSVPSDGTSKNDELSSVRSNIIQKPTYAEIVRKVKSTARRKTR